MTQSLSHELDKFIAASAVLRRPEDLLLYEYDGSVARGRPDPVVFPSNTDEMSRIVKLAVHHKIPVIGRGAGTGLFGGALAPWGGVLVAFTRMNRILALENQRAVCNPVSCTSTSLAPLNTPVFTSRLIPAQNPAPSGGNVAENAGGPTGWPVVSPQIM